MTSLEYTIKCEPMLGYFASNTRSNLFSVVLLKIDDELKNFIVCLWSCLHKTFFASQES